MSRLPSWLQGLSMLVVGLISITLGAYVAAQSGGTQALWWAGFLAALVVVGVIVRRQTRRRLGGRDQVAMFRRALRTGEVPEDADREAWRRLLEEQRRSRSGLRWFWGSFALLVAAVNVRSAVTSDMPPVLTVVLLLVAVVLAVGLWVGIPLLLQRRQERKLDALSAQLGA